MEKGINAAGSIGGKEERKMGANDARDNKYVL